ncbi:hypothetical protein ACOBV8_17170 [Pseudoalteromonas espejiana]
MTILGVLFLAAFGGLSLVSGSRVLGTILLINALVGLINLYLLKRSGNVERAAKILSGILFVLSMSLLITGGENNTGMLWIYPIVAINLFINRFWPAVFVFSIFSIASALLLFTPLSALLMTSYSLTESGSLHADNACFKFYLFSCITFRRASLRNYYATACR